MKHAVKSLLLLVWCASSALSQTIPESDLPSFPTVSDSDAIRIIKNGVSGKSPASAVRQITASKITDATVVGRNWITTASPGAVTFPMVNVDNTITYLNATAFLAAIGASPTAVTIREVDGLPSVQFSVLEVPNGTLVDLGSGIASLLIGTGGGGGGASDFVELTGTATDGQIPDNITIDLATTATTAATANAGDSATAFFVSGQIERARGGTEADTSAFGNGILGSNASNATIDIDTLTEFSTALGITGTPSSSTFVRGDGSWATPIGTGDMLAANNLSDLANTATARTNLGVAINSIGFNGNLTLADDTIQEVAQKVDDLVLGGGSGTPPGADTQVIFNDGGVFGADADLTWNKTTNILSFPTMATTLLTTSNFKVLDTVDQSHGLNWVVSGNWTANKTLTYTGEFNLGITLTGDSSITVPAGTVSLASNPNASGFNGNLTTTDDTLQEIAQKFDDFTTGPAGSDTQVIFNDGGGLSGDADMTYNKTTNVLTIPNIATTNLNAAAFKVLDAVNQSHGYMFSVPTDITADKSFQIIGGFNFSLTLGANSTLAMSGDAITFADNTRQTFNPGTTTPGINVGAYAGDPSTPSNGDLWYDSTNNTLDARINGATVSLGAGGGGSLSDGDKGEVIVSGSGATWLLDDGFAVSGAVLTSPRIVTNLLDTNGNELFVLTATASAVNEVTFSNGAAGNNPKFLASGGDSAIGIDFETKGAAGLRFLGNSTQSARVRMHEDTDNGTNQISIVAPASIVSDIDVELPATAGTLLVSSGPLGTPSSGTLTNATGLPISTGVSGLGTGVATLLATPSSANLRAALTDEVGAGAAMFTRTGVLRTVYINAGAMISRTTNGAATGTVELATNDIMFDSFDFDSTTSEGVGFWWTPPTTYNAGTVTVKFNWTAASGSGTATWSISARAFGDDDAMDQALGTAQATTDTLITANDMHVTSTTSALTIAGTPAANKPTYWQITRDIADTLSSDARLLGCTIEYTESATEPSAQ